MTYTITTRDTTYTIITRDTATGRVVRHNDLPLSEALDLLSEAAIEDIVSQPGYARLEHRDAVLENVHDPYDCAGEHCTVHNRSDHHMRHMPQHWRSDRGIMERICEHGVGHPDPDTPEFNRWGEPVDGTHGCDGCCRPPREPYIAAGELWGKAQKS